MNWLTRRPIQALTGMANALRVGEHLLSPQGRGQLGAA